MTVVRTSWGIESCGLTDRTCRRNVEDSFHDWKLLQEEPASLDSTLKNKQLMKENRGNYERKRKDYKKISEPETLRHP